MTSKITWSMQAQRITIALIDHSAGFEASPERVRMSDLADFSADVATFFRGDGKDIDVKTLEVSIRNGSLAIETMPLSAAPRLFGDLSALLVSELLDGVDAKRREVMERSFAAKFRTMAARPRPRPM